MNTYSTCLADYECVLPAIAKTLLAPYQSGDFDSIESSFIESGENDLTWAIVGIHGTLKIELEKYEGYFFSTLEAREPHFSQCVELLESALIGQGGNVVKKNN